MPANKNQHFVPRAYLKPFTLDREGKAINLYNIGRAMGLEGAPVKSQCSGDYFYGKDLEIENGLKVIETAYGAFVSRASTDGYALSDRDARIILAFWLVQHVRTEAEAKADLEISLEVEGIVGAPEVFTKPTLAETVQLLMSSFQDHTEELFDLSVVLVRNRSDIPFFTSDHPAVMTNRWMQKDARSLGLSHGIQSAGLLCILPITPEVMAIGYDGGVYSIPSKNGWADFRADSDAESFNALQVMVAGKNLYFRDWTQLQRIAEQVNTHTEYRTRPRHRISQYVQEDAPGGETRFVLAKSPEALSGARRVMMDIHIYRPYPPSWPSILKWRPSGAVYWDGSAMGYVRRYIAARHGGHFKKHRA